MQSLSKKKEEKKRNEEKQIDLEAVFTFLEF